ncbi:hypothetical protein [Nostoc sp. TCL26-01]|uniref:hypothetical protein n=1 Tax=Nostoc sp. TCL26-01 TaxID=2576904 RepID=UPI0015C07713|nr:hypothetical protein [Nostoc sp. TCL26-01]QLE54260.1 hypothetical protein FD725_01175 [Nostoc sp. TCL26-01]
MNNHAKHNDRLRKLTHIPHPRDRFRDELEKRSHDLDDKFSSAVRIFATMLTKRLILLFSYGASYITRHSHP